MMVDFGLLSASLVLFLALAGLMVLVFEHDATGARGYAEGSRSDCGEARDEGGRSDDFESLTAPDARLGERADKAAQREPLQASVTPRARPPVRPAAEGVASGRVAGWTGFGLSSRCPWACFGRLRRLQLSLLGTFGPAPQPKPPPAVPPTAFALRPGGRSGHLDPTAARVPMTQLEPSAAAPIARRERERRYRALQELSYDQVQLRLARAEAWLADVSRRLAVEIEIARVQSEANVIVPLEHIETLKGRVDAFLNEDASCICNASSSAAESGCGDDPSSDVSGPCASAENAPGLFDCAAKEDADSKTGAGKIQGQKKKNERRT